MMINPIYRRAHHAGRMATVSHRLRGEAMPACPFGRNSIRARYWRQGTRDAERLIGEIDRLRAELMQPPPQPRGGDA